MLTQCSCIKLAKLGTGVHSVQQTTVPWVPTPTQCEHNLQLHNCHLQKAHCKRLTKEAELNAAHKKEQVQQPAALPALVCLKDGACSSTVQP